MIKAKKGAVLILASLLMTTSLIGCKNSAEQTVNSEETVAQTETEKETETKKQTDETTSDIQATLEYKQGYWDNNLYLNKSIGFMVSLPSGWQSGTPDQIEALQDQNAETDPDAIEGDYQKAIYDLYMYSPTTAANIMMIADDLSNYEAVTAEEYLNMVGEEMVSNSDDNVTFTYTEPDTYKLGKAEFTAIAIEGNYGSTTICQFYAVYIMGDKIVVLVASGDSTSIEECFNVLDNAVSI